MRILILGSTGMLGHTLFRSFQKDHLDVFAVMRKEHTAFQKYKNQIHYIQEINDIYPLILKEKYDYVINCIGVIKQVKTTHLDYIKINSLLPHELAKVCAEAQSRLILVSTDCVFKGDKGMYLESEDPDATDIYGKSKALGEILDMSHVVTLRTSIIGHELERHASLVDWFLKQLKNTPVKGYTEAYFSGFPTVEIARILKKHVFSQEISGLYHVASPRISKYDLLSLINKIYQLNFYLEKNDSLVIDRSLDASKFFHKTGYQSPSWEKLIQDMYNDYSNSKEEYYGAIQG